MSKITTWRYLAVALAAGLLLASCGQDEGLKGTPEKDGIPCKPVSVDRTTTPPTIEKIAKVTKTASKDLKKGKGCGTDFAPYLSFDIVGATAKDGKVFFTTYGTDRPLGVTLGSGSLLPALEAQLTSMKVGGRRQITIPAKDAYGAAGSPEQGIGPNLDVEFVVDFVAVADKVTTCNANYSIPKGKLPDKPTHVDMPLTITKLVKKDLTVGTGRVAEKGKKVTVHYLLITCPKGTQEESSWDSGEPLVVDELGAAGLIEGFAQGIEGMKEGGVRQIEVPTDLAYGNDGSSALSGQDLVFVIKVLKVEDAPATTTTTTVAGGTTTAPGGSSTTTPADGTTSTTAGDGTTTSTTAPETTTSAG
jgi:peptidylprolyl isomerase